MSIGSPEQGLFPNLRIIKKILMQREICGIVSRLIGMSGGVGGGGNDD